MKAAVRIYSLTLGGAGPKTLSAMERHGKREDQSSKRRRVRDVAPLVHGSLHLREAYDAHVDGCKMNKGLKRPVLHAVIQFPPELAKSEKNRRVMLAHAVRFINDTHGGDAVFAARLDQDEEGLGAVDVFFTPKYEKITRAGASMWVSTSKHGKELAEKHRAEIERRHKGRFSTGPRQVGIALQAELYDYLGRTGLKLEPRKLKDGGGPDRIEPEEHRARLQADEIQRKAEETLLKAQETLKEAEKDAERVRGAVARLRKVLGAIGDRLGAKVSRTIKVALDQLEETVRPQQVIGAPSRSSTEDPGEEPVWGLDSSARRSSSFSDRFRHASRSFFNSSSCSLSILASVRASASSSRS